MFKADTVAFLFLLVPALSNATSDFRCADLFSSHQEIVGNSVFTSDELKSRLEDLEVKNKTVFVKGEAHDESGRLLRLEKQGESWRSKFKLSNFTFEGSPLYFPIILGGKIARIFGFYRISASQMLVPTAERLNNAIQKLNNLLIKKNLEPMSFRFYDTGKEEEVPLEELLVRFVKESSLPLSSRGNLVVHDISYHTASVLLPKRVLDHARVQSDLVLQFKKYLKQRVGLSEKDSDGTFLIDKVLHNLIYLRVAQTDKGTGNLSLALVSYLRTRDYSAYKENMKYQTLEPLIGDGLSAKEYLKLSVLQAIGEYPTILLKLTGPLAKELNDKVKTSLDEFIGTLTDPIYDSSLSTIEGNEYSVDNYINDVQQRVKELRSLVQ